MQVTVGAAGMPADPTNLGFMQVLVNRVDSGMVRQSITETDYYVERADGSGGTLTWSRIATLAANTTTYVDLTVAEFTTYSYRVIAHNAVGDSQPSNVIAVTTPATVPARPTNLRTTSVAYNLVNLAWNDVSNNETAFYLERGRLTGGIWVYARIATLPANTTTYGDSTVAASTQYHYRMQAANSAGTSAYTSVLTVTTPGSPNPVPIAPSNLIATAQAAGTARSISLQWNDNSNNETGFRVYRSLNQITWTLIATTGANVRTYINTGLARNTTYYYRVAAFNAVGTSTQSNMASARTAP